jgi:hypothetical protein
MGGTDLNMLLNYNYQGATHQITVPINSIARPAYTFSNNPSSLGDSSLGELPLGDSIIVPGEGTLPKFKVINSLSLENIFEYQPVYYSDATNAQWEILATGDNARVEEQEQANYIINKLR